MRCRAIAAGLIAAAAAAAAAGTAAPAKAAPEWPDRTPPQIHIQLPESTADGWFKEPVEVWVSATDNYGIADIRYEITGAHTGSGRTDWTGFFRQIKNEGVTTLKIWATDGVGNQTYREHGIGIDLTEPTVGFGGPAADGRVIRQGSAPVLTFACADVPTHVTSCYGRVGDVPFHSGDRVPTAEQGPQAVTVTAVDAVGRWVERQFTYTVAEPQLIGDVRPSITGASGPFARPGQILTATGGGFSPDATRVEYRWTVGDREPVTGATYEVRPEDVRQQIRLTAVGTRAGYASNTVDADRLAVVEASFQVTGDTSVTGTAREGQTLQLVAPPVITPSPVSVTAWWRIDGGPVFKTDLPRLALTSAHVGKRIECRLTIERPGYSGRDLPCRFAGGATSVVVTGNAWTVRSPARTTGKAKVRTTLRAVAPVLSGRAERYAYQWLRNGAVIKGATATTYRLRAKDAKARISVRVTATTAHRPATVSVSPAQRVKR